MALSLEMLEKVIVGIVDGLACGDCAQDRCWQSLVEVGLSFVTDVIVNCDGMV